MVREDLTGQRFFRLTVDSYAGTWRYPSGKTRSLWNCTCDCGNKVVAKANELKNGNTKSCGCWNLEQISNRRFKDLSGNMVGHIKVIKRVGTYKKTEKTSTPTYLCECTLCGVQFIERADYLRSGDVSSCGCLIKKREAQIEKILRDKNVLYACQVNLQGLTSENNYDLWFDFAVFGSDRILRFIIEEQGITHRQKSEKLRDSIKKEYCKTHNIALEEIWFNENIEERMNQLLDKYLHANPVPSVFDEGETTISYESTRLVKFQRGSAVPLQNVG